MTTADGELGIYGIDDDQIDGAFEIQVEARFDDLSQDWQRIFDFGNGPQQDNIVLTQEGGSDDLRFAVYIGDKKYLIVARDVLVEGEVAKWIASVDPTGYMRLYKNDELVAEGQGAVTRDVERTSNLVGESNWDGDDALNGMVRFLEIVNEGDLPEYIHIGTPKIGFRALGDVVEGDGGETTALVFEAYLDQPAPAIVTADVIVEGGEFSAPGKLVIGAGQTSGLVELTVAGNTAFNVDTQVTVSLENVTEARVEGPLTASAKVLDDDAGVARDLLDAAQLVGDARAQDGGVRLTADSRGQEGALGTADRIDFTQDFKINATVYLGDNDRGADGMGFMFHNEAAGSAAIGGGGGDLGIKGIRSGFGFELDTYKGRGDIGEDHFAYVTGRDYKRIGDNIALPNLEDGQTHDVEIVWDASAQQMTTRVDGQLMGSVFGAEIAGLLGDDFAYLTIAAATGGKTNEHRVDTLSFIGKFEGEKPILTLSAPEAQVEGGAGDLSEMVFVANLSEPSEYDVTAVVEVIGAEGPSSVTIPAGATSADIFVTYLGDDDFDGDTTVWVKLSEVTNAAVETGLTASATVLEDDIAPPVLTLMAGENAVEGAAGETGTLRFTAELDRPAEVAVVANVMIDGPASGPASIVIEAGATTAMLELSFDGNDLHGDDQAVTVRLDAVENAIVGDVMASATILDDDIPSNLLQFSELSGYAGRQDRGDGEISEDGGAVTLTGNAWKAAFDDYVVTENTFIRLDLTLRDAGEVTGLMFDTDNRITEETSFQFSGSQNWGRSGSNRDFYERFDSNSAPETRSIEFRVGEYFTGSFDRLVFVGDDDRNASTDVTFSNISLSEGILFGGSRYEVGTAGLSWEAANAEAIAKGGKIVEIGSAEEDLFIFETFGGDANPIWLGLTDTAEEGRFVDGDGNDAVYTNWLPGEPNNHGSGQDYAIMASSTGQWDDSGNGGGAFFDGRWNGGYSNQLIIEYELG